MVIQGELNLGDAPISINREHKDAVMKGSTFIAYVNQEREKEVEIDDLRIVSWEKIQIALYVWK